MRTKGISLAIGIHLLIYGPRIWNTEMLKCCISLTRPESYERIKEAWPDFRFIEGNKMELNRNSLKSNALLK